MRQICEQRNNHRGIFNCFINHLDMVIEARVQFGEIWCMLVTYGDDYCRNGSYQTKHFADD
jgi:hypothetical protein